MSDMPERVWIDPDDPYGFWEEEDPEDGSPEYIRADLAAERERALREALEFAERRSRQPGEGHTEYFERIAEEFYSRHGYLAPGKDDPMRSVSLEEAQEAWEAFLHEPTEARRTALAHPEHKPADAGKENHDG
jgi:hypothetical protein